MLAIVTLRFDCDVKVRPLAVTEQQILEWNLPTRPTKESDPRARNWSGGDQSVELDALSPEQMSDLIESAIISLIDQDEWQQIQEAERLDRETLEKIAQRAGKKRM
jgi:hypothetical protein